MKLEKRSYGLVAARLRARVVKIILCRVAAEGDLLYSVAAVVTWAAREERCSGEGEKGGGLEAIVEDYRNEELKRGVNKGDAY